MPERQAGRALDDLIAGTLMRPASAPPGHGPLGAAPLEEVSLAMYADRVSVPPYSTDIAAAWLVVEHLCGAGWQVVGESRPDGWLVRFVSGDDGRRRAAEAARLPLAVCRAALATLDADDAQNSLLNVLLPVFSEVLLPIVVIAGMGYLLQGSFPPDARTLNRAGLYVLSSQLLFVTLLRAEISGGAAVRFSLLLLVVLGMLGVACATSRVLVLDDLPLRVGVVQATIPTAVNTTILALEFDTWPRFVSNVVVETTLGRLLTLLILIGFVRQRFLISGSALRVSAGGCLCFGWPVLPRRRSTGMAARGDIRRR